MVDEQMFFEAQEAIKNGQKSRARDLLNRLLKVDRNNVNYWLYLSTVVDTREEKVACLKQALALDPANSTALRGLSLLGQADESHTFASITPNRTRKFDTVVNKANEHEAENGSSARRVPTLQLFALSFISLLGVVLIYVGIFGNPFAPRQPRYILPSVEDLIANASQATPTPTPLEIPENLSTAVFSGATPLASLLDVTFTPTPLVVNTPHPNSPAYALGLQAYQAGNYEKAVEQFLEHIQKYPGDGDVRFYLGLAYFQLGEYDNADLSFQYAEDVQPELGIAYLWEAITKQTYLQAPNISQQVNAAVRYAPDYFYSYLERGRYFLKFQNMELALNDLEKALELGPENAEVHLFAAQYYLANQLFEPALEFAQSSMALDPTILDTYLILARAYFYNAHYEESVGPLQVYLGFKPEDTDAWMLLGRANQNFGAHETAIAAFKTVLELDFKKVTAHYYLGQSYFQMGQFEEAFEQFDLAYFFFPDWFEAKVYHGVSLMEKGAVGEAYLLINASSSLAKNQFQWANLYYWRAHSLERLNEPEKAKEDWAALLAIDPEYMPAEWRALAEKALLGNYPTPVPYRVTPTRVPTHTPSP